MPLTKEKIEELQHQAHEAIAGEYDEQRMAGETPQSPPDSEDLPF